jgi:hypothetical protein
MKKKKESVPQQQRAPWPFPLVNGKPLLPAKKFDLKNWPDATF